MTIFLIVANLLLIAAVIYLALKQAKGAGSVFSSLEDIELIEFQQNLKELINELHKVSENEIAQLDARKKEICEAMAAADTKIKELRYLIDRNQLIRKSEYKSAISQGPVNPEEVLFSEIRKPAEPVKKPKPQPAKFIINDAPAENIEISEERPEENKGRTKYEHINSLIKNGLAVEEIAKVTGLSRGEIELIKNIKK
jgi:hypothetical protein